MCGKIIKENPELLGYVTQAEELVDNNLFIIRELTTTKIRDNE